MRSAEPRWLESSRPLQPLRLIAAALLAASAVAVTGAGILLGGVLQERFEARPTVGQAEALGRIGAPLRAPSRKGGGVDRGPNRADLGGARADLGAAR